MKTKILLCCAASLLLFSTTAFAADCTRAPTGRMVCNNGQSAGSYNPNTGRARSSQTNSNGVTTTQTNSGAKAKTKNGNGIAEAPGGKTCAKTANHEGCN